MASKPATSELGSGHLSTRLTSDPSNIAAVRRAVEELCCCKGGLDRDSAAEVGLCVNEALANIMRHAYGGAAGKPIDVTAQCQGDTLVVTIRDWGNGVNPDSLPPRPYDPLEPGGLGLICLRRMMTEVTYVPQRDGMLLIMKKRRPSNGNPAKGGASPQPGKHKRPERQ
jgi:anti-sigma regulatory factor (Ser/Thr protein kinase)